MGNSLPFSLRLVCEFYNVPQTSKSMHEWYLSLNKGNGTIRCTTGESKISNQNTFAAMQNKTQSEDLPAGNRRTKSTRFGKGARRDRDPPGLPWKRILNLFNNSKVIKRYVRFIFCIDSSVLRKIKTKICGSKAVGIICAKGSTFSFCYWLCLCFQNTEQLQNIKGIWSSVSCFSWRTCTCCSVLLNKVQETKAHYDSSTLNLFVSASYLMSHRDVTWPAEITVSLKILL